MSAIEIFVFVQVGQWIGYGWAIVALIAIALFGIWLVKREGLGTWRRAQAQMRAGEIPAGEAVDGALIAGAGLLLIIPGFVTDVIGLLLLLPPLRWAAQRRTRRLHSRPATRPGTDPAPDPGHARISPGGRLRAPGQPAPPRRPWP